jgi:chemotaxis response regulator CheB
LDGAEVVPTRPAFRIIVMAASSGGVQALGLVLKALSAGLPAAVGGGLDLVQVPGDAAVPSMPESALEQDHPSPCLPVTQIGELLNRRI